MLTSLACDPNNAVGVVTGSAIWKVNINYCNVNRFVYRLIFNIYVREKV